MIGWLRASMTAGAVALLSLGAWEVCTLKRDRDALAAKNASLASENASLERSHSALILEREQAREARSVADAYRVREAADAERFRAIKNNIRKGPDDEMPNWYLEHLRDLGLVRPADRAD